MNILLKSPDRRKPPKDDYLDDLPICTNCGEPFEEHTGESDPPYMCPYEHQRQPHYGYKAGPEFYPDHELCSEEEIRENRGVGITVFPYIYYSKGE